MNKDVPNVPHIVMSKDGFRYKDEDVFWTDMSKLMQILTNNDYNVMVRYDDCNNYVIEYVYRDKSLGDTRYIAVSAEQEEMFYNTLEEG